MMFSGTVGTVLLLLILHRLPAFHTYTAANPRKSPCTHPAVSRLLLRPVQHCITERTAGRVQQFTCFSEHTVLHNDIMYSSETFFMLSFILICHPDYRLSPRTILLILDLSFSHHSKTLHSLSSPLPFLTAHEFSVPAPYIASAPLYCQSSDGRSDHLRPVLHIFSLL